MRAATRRHAALVASGAPLLALMTIASLAAVGVALVSQHLYGIEPCPWCVLQRAVLVLIAIVCLLGLAWRNRSARLIAGALIALLAVGGGAAALWQHYVAAASASCNLTLADRIIGALALDRLAPEVFSPRASCADAAVNLAGVPYDFWSLALFVLLLLGAVWLMRDNAG